MTKSITRPITAILVLCALIAPGAALAFDDAARTEIGEIIREYLLENPELMIEVQEELERRQVAEEDAARAAVLASAAEDLFNNPADPVLGNPDGDVTVVEFFDYNCGFCRRALSDMQTIIEEDPNVRFVLKEFPILGPQSVDAHNVAVAVHELAPEKYEAFHVRLLEAEGRADMDTAIAIAGELGIEEKSLRTAMVLAPPQNVIQQTYELAQGLGISGTPSYVIGDALVPGALGVEELRARIAEERAAN
ncbi:MAG: DsbA family protein [Pseudomonadota bacterium]